MSGVGPASGHRVRTTPKPYPVYTTGADHRPPEVPRIMNVFLYVRLSRSTDESTSVERQTAAAKELAYRRGWTVLDVFVDDGVSGAANVDERPAMSRMMARLAEADAIVCWKLDRLARSFLAFADLMARCEAAKVAIVSVTEPIDTTTPMGRAMVQIIAVFAELERSTIRERILDTKAHLRSLGNRHMGGRPAYGLRIEPAPDGKGKILVRDPEAVEILAEILRRMAYGRDGHDPMGEPRERIANDLNARGVQSARVRTSLKPNPKPPKHGWTKQAIGHIVRHPSVMGWRVDERGHIIRDAEGKPVEFWEPVTDWQTYERAIANMDARSHERAPSSDAHWLEPVLVCGECGHHRLYQNARNGRRNREMGWDTDTVLVCKAAGCSGVLITNTKVSAYVTETFLAAHGDRPAQERRYVQGVDVSADLRAVQRAISALRDDRDAGLFDDDEDDYRDRMRALITRRKALEATPTRPAGWETVETGRTVREEWELRSPAQRGELIAGMGMVLAVYSARRRRNITTAERSEWFSRDEWDAYRAALAEDRASRASV